MEGFYVPVLNEREIRASAGILFLGMFISLMLILFKGNFLVIKYFIILFLIDMLIRVFVNPKFSPFLIIGRIIVSKQVPEYVGAPQKKFAWKIGILLASLMFTLLVVLNSYSIITGLGCLICLIFLFFESAFGICLGCLIFPLFYKDKAKYCAGEVCEVRVKEEIQKTSWAQIFILILSVVFLILLFILFNNSFSKNPVDLWSIISF